MTTPAPSPTLPDSDTVSLALADLEQLCLDAVRAAGGSAQTAVSLASATVAAERRGRSEVGGPPTCSTIWTRWRTGAWTAGRVHGS